MIKRLTIAAVPLATLLSAGCVSQSTYDQLQAENEQLKAQLAQSQAQQKWVIAGDVLFPEGGYQLGANGQVALSEYVSKLQGLQNAKVVIYGYTDNLPVGPALQRAGIRDNIDLASRRAANVVAYFRAQGVNPNILAAKGFGETHPVASNDTPEGRAQNRRIEIVLEGPGA
jgi:chemotaxis protein MotB